MKKVPVRMTSAPIGVASQAVSQFAGNVVVTVSQAQKDGLTTSIKIRPTGLKSLSLNQLAGTISAELFKMITRHRMASIRMFKASEPVTLHIADEHGNEIADTSVLSTEFAQRLTLRSEKAFAMALFLGLEVVNNKAAETRKVTDLPLSERDAKYINAHDLSLVPVARIAEAVQVAEAVETV